jgi:hypothetical protein
VTICKDHRVYLLLPPLIYIPPTVVPPESQTPPIAAAGPPWRKASYVLDRCTEHEKFVDAMCREVALDVLTGYVVRRKGPVRKGSIRETHGDVRDVCTT